MAAAKPIEHETLREALLGFQSEAVTLQKSALNPHFKHRYVPLETVMAEVLPALNKHGLTWTTFPTVLDGQAALTYTLEHAASGSTREGTMLLMAAKEDPQGQGSAITYARRYSIMAVLGLTADEDDDGNRAAKRKTKAPSEQPATVPELESLEKAVSYLLGGIVPDSFDVRKVLGELKAEGNGSITRTSYRAIARVAAQARVLREATVGKPDGESG